MLKQMYFIPFILRGIDSKQHLYAADILFQLYRCHKELTVEDFVSFFRNRNPFPVWETIMALKDMGYIKSQSRRRFTITDTGKAKVQMMLACLRAGYGTR